MAPERGGSPADYANFVSLAQNLRAAMDKSGHHFGLTATAPSSHWYMQHFDIVNLSQTLDWINVMTYDLHGTWDATDPSIGAVALAHTNLTEIKQTLDLFWRNNVDPDKIVLGLAFYGRSFTLADPSCQSAGCPFSGGAVFLSPPPFSFLRFSHPLDMLTFGTQKPGPCSQNSGTLTAYEIRQIIASGATQVTLDPEAAVEIATWGGDQWLSYDDFPTFKMKIDWANEVCLGGVMVWAVDQDDGQATMTNQLARALGLPASSAVMAPPDANVTVPDQGVVFSA